MILQELKLQNFRSYKKTTFQFSSETTLIIGPNTAGKTNILEAIMMMATGKSFRADADREAITWGSDIGRVIAEIESGAVRGSSFAAHPSNPSAFSLSSISKEDMTVLEKIRRAAPDGVKLELVITNGEVQGQKVQLKKYLVNGVARRAIDFVGNLSAVLFWPEHLELVTDSPSLRRKYLDSVLVQVDREYRRNLMSYERGLRQRNRLLDLINEGTAHRQQLLFWDQLLIKAGGYITNKREEYINFVNTYSVPNIQYSTEYDKSVISEARLDQYKDEEVSAKATLVGPHRDDFVITRRQETSFGKTSLGKSRDKQDKRDKRQESSNIVLSKYGSRGEQRLAVLWLKLAELSYIEHESGDRPILLLDDIFSELDEAHRNLVIDLIGRQQTIVTSADRDIIHIIPKAAQRISL